MIEIRGLEKSFGDLKVLDQIDLTIEHGEIYGLVGKSGAGKSTLLRCINGLEQYSAGSIQVDGVEVKDLSRKEMRNFRKGVSMIFQHFPMLARKTVYENIAFPMRCWGYKKQEIDQKVKELAQLVGISEKLTQRPGQLSGGQKQRVAIARSLSMEPKILLSDEATSALDPVTTRAILQLLRDINEKLGITIIVVTHQMSVIKDVCEKVTLLEQGKLVVSGRVEDLFMNQPEELKTFLGEETFQLQENGVYVQVMLSDENGSKNILSRMSRELELDFAIVNSEMERYRDQYLGYVVIHIEKNDCGQVEEYLNRNGVIWRYYMTGNERKTV
ncbi:MAG: methionine ABC transporter ATP-binding protein [Lachnospiraceae bacterium]|jgi:D-methionine transport system ATP-binding protein|nr:methionine ABC transporter ATP-binding protein [Lachnospiraceae bacterium]